MKLTKSKLKEIIREEIKKLKEGNLPSNIQKWIRDRGPKPSKDVKMIGKWVKKSYDESTKNNAVVVMLIPVRTDTKYWHDYIMKGASMIYFVKGRLKFKNKVIADYTGKTNLSPAPFPSVVVVFGGLRWSPGPRVASLERQ